MKEFEHYTDIQIIQKVLKGEILLYELLIRRNNSPLYKIGRSYNYNHEDTQDLMQEAFIDAYLNLGKFENRSSFKTWIVKIMLNKCYKKQQKFGTKKEIVGEIWENSTPLFLNWNSDTNKTIMNRELNFVIEHAVQKLPEKYRLVFSLREINGMSVSETAEMLNISEANVKVRLNRAKTILRKEVEKSYSPEEIFEFNLVYCDGIVERVMKKIMETNN